MWTDEQVKRAARIIAADHAECDGLCADLANCECITYTRAALDAALGDTHIVVPRSKYVVDCLAFIDSIYGPAMKELAGTAALTPPREPSEEKKP
jgi:hypothetical protein